MERLLTRVSSAERTPAAGSAATAAAALAAALITKVARRSREVWPEAGGAIAQATALDSRLWVNAAALEMSYEAATAALETSNQPRIAETLPQAAEDSLELARIAADLAELALEAGHHCDQAHHADMTVAAVLAEAAARSGALLVTVNLLSRSDDGRSSEARQLVTRAESAAETLAREG